MKYTQRAPHAPQAAKGPIGRDAGAPVRIRAMRPARAKYDRPTALARVLALWPHEIDDESSAGRQRILAKLRRALRAERRRGVAGHWTYDLARHAELLRVYKQELQALSTRRGLEGPGHGSDR